MPIPPVVYPAGGPVATAPAAPSNLDASYTPCDGNGGDVELTFDDNSTDETEWVVYQDGVFFDQVSSTTQGSTGQVTITASGPLNSGLRTFTVAAQNAIGESAESPGDSVDVPDAPSMGAVSASWNSTLCVVSLSWSDSSNECEYFVERKLQSESDSAYSQIANPGQDATGYSDPGADAQESYDYRVKASNDRGDSAWQEASITTGTCEGPS